MNELGPNAQGKPAGHFLDELRAVIAARGGQEAIKFADRAWTYSELDARARRWARAFLDAGVEPGDRVAIAIADKRVFLPAHLGAIYAGAISLPLNPRFTRDEMHHVLADSGAAVVVAGVDAYESITSQHAALSELRRVLNDTALPDDAPIMTHDISVDRDAPCLMLYSSGTTGRPKGVLHTHANLSSSLRALQACWRFSADDTLVNVLPLFHIHGLSFGAHLSLLSGARMVVADSFHPRHTLELIGQGTVFMAIPTFYYSFLDRPEFATAARTWEKVRLFTCGSAPIRPEVLPDLEKILGRPVINRYGMTESHVIASLPLDGPWPSGSVGLPLDGIEVRIVTESGDLAAAGDVGAVQVRGPNLFAGYWRRPEATAEAFASGWFATGDLGTRDRAGFLTLVGRANDLIITNGFNVYPQVVERVIGECPGVSECVVIGMPDRKRGERVTAVVVRRDEALDGAALKAFVHERLVDYQRPMDFIFVADLPRNAMGKIPRREVRERLANLEQPKA